MVFQWAVGVLAQPACDGVRKIVFAYQGFADDVGVCERSGRMGEEVSEVEAFVRGDLQNRRFRSRKLGKRGDKGIGGGRKLRSEGG